MKILKTEYVPCFTPSKRFVICVFDKGILKRSIKWTSDFEFKGVLNYSSQVCEDSSRSRSMLKNCCFFIYTDRKKKMKGEN